MKTLLTAAAATLFIETALALALTVMPRLSRRAVNACARTPLLDIWVAAFTWLPWVIAGVVGGWRAVVGSFIGQVLALFIWTAYHELAHREAARGPRIVKFINRTVGRWRNHAALWVTMIALPGFCLIRAVEVCCYPFLVWLLDFPKYRHADWVNVSRQKFEGLVGHDLIWCLYCDWMTGVYSLGAEMLRNVESFWCPIRFYEGKKCANCRTDFPDIEQGWVAPDGTMADVEQTLQAMYGDGQRSWFGHPARLTVKGVPIAVAAGNGNGDTEHAATARL